MVKSYAKINLILKILEKRSDGYHHLISLFQRIDLWDRLSFEPIDGGIIVETNHKDLPCDQSNLVYQAATLLFKNLDLKKGVKIFIEKNIPIGAGLGGGSSNAAATLITLNKLWGLNYSLNELAKLGEPLGSDVPFFCYNCSSAWVSGRGEIVRPVPLSLSFWILLVFPGFLMSTYEAYRALDSMRQKGKIELTKQGDHNTISSLYNLKVDDLFSFFENDFEPVLFTNYPVLKEIQHCLLEEKAEKVLLSGSGSALFGIFSMEENARMAMENLKKRFSHERIIVSRCF